MKKKRIPKEHLDLFSRNLKDLREKKNMTQETLAEKIDKSTTSISDYENAHKEPGIITVQKIANILDVSIDELCENTPLTKYKQKLKNSPVYAIFTVLDQLKPQIHVSENTITFTISSENDCAGYSSHEILKFFQEYEIIQTFANSKAPTDMINLLKDNLEKRYKHLPDFSTYEQINIAEK